MPALAQEAQKKATEVGAPRSMRSEPIEPLVEIFPIRVDPPAIHILDVLDRNPQKSPELFEAQKAWSSPTVSPHCDDETRPAGVPLPLNNNPDSLRIATISRLRQEQLKPAAA
jgi:hypothetical protein